MKEFWQEIWEYLGTLPVEIASRQITNMWFADSIEQVIRDWEEKKISEYGDSVRWIYEYLCMICNNIAKEKLPDNLHARMVLGEQNRYTKEYISRCGV